MPAATRGDFPSKTAVQNVRSVAVLSPRMTPTEAFRYASRGRGVPRGSVQNGGILGA